MAGDRGVAAGPPDNRRVNLGPHVLPALSRQACFDLLKTQLLPLEDKNINLYCMEWF